MKSNVVLISAAPFESLDAAKALNVQTSLQFGIGAIQASRNSLKIASECANKHVIFIGSCGTFGEFSSPFLITTTSVFWLPTCERIGSAYRVQGIDPPVKLKSKVFSDLPDYDVICSPSISLVRDLPKEFQPQKTAENLELYPIAQVLDGVAKSFSVILGVTNAIGPNAHQQWKDHFKSVAAMTARYLEENQNLFRE